MTATHLAAVTPATMMAVALSRLLRDGETVFHGVASPLPLVAIQLARETHAPHLVYLNIAGAIDAEPAFLPRSTVDPVLTQGSHALVTLADIFDLSARGELDTAFLGGVQIDAQARINMSAIGPHDRPKIRLPGGAGSAFLMSTARRILLWRTRHDTRTFVEQVPFATASGNVDRVVTPLCVFRREPDTGRLAVESIHPYSSAEEVAVRTGFEVNCHGAHITPPPTAEELESLDRVDPGSLRSIEFEER